MNKKIILKKTAQVSVMTMLSRILGIWREVLQLRFLGFGALSDAWITAWGMPNFLRKIFAEGALSAAFIPTFVNMVHTNDKKKAQGLMSLSFIFFEGILLVLCVLVILFPATFIKLNAPGFSQAQVAQTIPLLRVLFPFIFFISSSSLLSGALQAAQHFFIPAFCQPLLNVFWIISLLIGIYFNCSVQVLSIGLLLGGFVQLLLHLGVYFQIGFSFGRINRESIQAFKEVLSKFVPCFLGASVMEVNFLIDRATASFLPEGSPTMIYYGNRFMQVPLAMFAIAFSTVLLPHFSKVILYAPRRMSFYLLEVTKFIAWVIAPATLLLIFEARQIFSTLLAGSKKTVTPHDITTASWVLIIFALGLLFFCVNKVLTNIFYAYKDTWAPSAGFTVSALVNLLGNILGMYFFGIFGVVASTVLSGVVLTVFFIITLARRHKVIFYGYRLTSFFKAMGIQLALATCVFIGMRYLVFYALNHSSWYVFLYEKWGYWFVESPLIGIVIFFLVITRKKFKIKMHFLDH